MDGVCALPRAIAKPIPAPPKNTIIKCIAPLAMAKLIEPLGAVIAIFPSTEEEKEGVAEPRIALPELAKAIAMIEEKTIAPVASLKAASDSINVESIFGTLTLLNISITIAALVGAINAAKAKATRGGRPAIYVIINPPANVARTTPTVASNNADILTTLNFL